MDFQLNDTFDAPVNDNSNGTGERISGRVGYQGFLLASNADATEFGRHSLRPGESVTIPGLTGIHQFRFGTFAETQAVARYPYTQTSDSGSTLLLTMVGLLTCALFSRYTARRKTQTP
jgi:hypothetical protein